MTTLLSIPFFVSAAFFTIMSARAFAKGVRDLPGHLMILSFAVLTFAVGLLLCR